MIDQMFCEGCKTNITMMGARRCLDKNCKDKRELCDDHFNEVHKTCNPANRRPVTDEIPRLFSFARIEQEGEQLS